MELPPEAQGPVHLLSSALRVDHLPLVGSVLKQLRVAEIIDDIVPDHPLRETSTGTCVEAMALSILMGSHTLYRVGETLSHCDTWLALGKDLDTDQLHDDRLGRALDMLFKVGLGQINSALVLEAIAAFDLDPGLVHTDTTTFSVHGAYPCGPEPDPENPESAPHVTRGFSKDRRPDLKQVTYGLTVCNDGFVPLLGRVTDGNRNDSLENAYTLKRLAEVMPDPRKLTLVGDCKLFSRRNMTLAQKFGLNFITIIPRGTKAWERAYKAAVPDLPNAPVLRELVEIEEVFDGDGYAIRDEEVRETWTGVTADTTHTWDGEDDELDGKTDLHCVVVHSTQLERAKRQSVARVADKEGKALEKLTKQLAKRDLPSDLPQPLILPNFTTPAI